MLGATWAVGVANGTDAIELALRGLGIGAGDTVITPSHTAIATVSAISRLGARPLFVDVDAAVTPFLLVALNRSSQRHPAGRQRPDRSAPIRHGRRPACNPGTGESIGRPGDRGLRAGAWGGPRWPTGRHLGQSRVLQLLTRQDLGRSATGCRRRNRPRSRQPDPSAAPIRD